MSTMVQYNARTGTRAQHNGINYVNPVGLTPAQAAERIEWAHNDGTNISWRTAGALLAQFPVIAGFCSMLPWLGVPFYVGGACLTTSLVIIAPNFLYEIGFRVGLARWDQAHGYQQV